MKTPAVPDAAARRAWAMRLRDELAHNVLPWWQRALFDAQPPTKISGLFSVRASKNTSIRRRSYCTRPPPKGPDDTDWMATANGWFCIRDTQSIAFFRPPGREKLYSGVQKITPSAARIASASAVASAGNPVEFWISAL